MSRYPMGTPESEIGSAPDTHPAAIARACLACHHFRLDRDHDDGMYFVVYSEWDDISSEYI